MAGHYGYKRFLLAAIVLFAAASIGCALSPDLDSMLIWRAIEIRAEQARTDQAAAAYRPVVLGALRDVETALVSYARAQVRGEKLAAEVAADRDAVNIATRLYRQGLEDVLPVLDAECSLYAADDKLALSERDTALAVVSLYKALGGGWQEVR